MNSPKVFWMRDPERQEIESPFVRQPRYNDLENRIAQLEAALRGAKTTHTTCDDGWYSCPLSEEGCLDKRETDCTCGAEKHNAAIEAALSPKEGQS
jgi:hypothetical protein